MIPKCCFGHLLKMKDYSSYTDIELLLPIKTGDEEAFKILFERYRTRLFYYLLRHTKSSEIAEEIVTDIFMKLWEGRELAEQIKEPAAFFHKVGYYKAMDFLRATSRSKQLQEVYQRRISNEEQIRPDELLIDRETKELLLEAVNQLPPQRRLIYRLSREQGMSHERIASALNISKSTVNNTIVSATRSIAEYLQKFATGRAAFSVLYFLLFSS